MCALRSEYLLGPQPCGPVKLRIQPVATCKILLAWSATLRTREFGKIVFPVNSFRAHLLIQCQHCGLEDATQKHVRSQCDDACLVRNLVDSFA